MRKELELMDTIEKYINGSLPEADKAVFEKRLSTDAALQKEVKLQQELMEGIKRTAIKQNISKGLKKYRLHKLLKTSGIAGAIIIAVTAAAFLIHHSATKSAPAENTVQQLPVLNEQGQTLWSDADTYLPLQAFELNPEKDTVIETNDGIVLAIPAHSFLDASGKPASGAIQLEVREALKAAEIMKAGLSTRSGDKLLETGGMFYINARQNDASLKIDPNNVLYAEVPATEIKPGMQLFEGKRLPDGTIDWINPKPIQKDLIPVDILSLNFYPPNYLDSLERWKYNTKDKAFTDSLYYSFASLFNQSFSGDMDNFNTEENLGLPDSVRQEVVVGNVGTTNKKSLSPQSGSSRKNLKTATASGEKIFKQNCQVCHSIGYGKVIGPDLEGVLTRVPSETWLRKFISNNKALIASGDAYANKIYKQYNKADMTVYAATMSDDELDAVINYIKNHRTVSDEGFSGINPAKIKSIWNKQFQNTLLATREFEERLPFVFNTCNGKVLDLYINNLDNNMSAIDSAAYQLCSKPEFLNFAGRGDGKVKNGNKNVQLLKKYYEEKTKLFTAIITKTKDEFWSKQARADNLAANKKRVYSDQDLARMNDNFKKELELNISAASGQMRTGNARSGITYDFTNGRSRYGVTIQNAGWHNVDRVIVVDAATMLATTVNRTSLTYKDTLSGRKAVITYQPLNVVITNLKNYDRVVVYLLPDELSSFMRMPNKNDAFEEKLNDLMIYKLVCIGYKGEQSFYFSQDNVRPGKLAVSLIKTDNSIIQDNVNKFGNLSHVKALNDELNYFEFEKQDTRRQQQLVKIVALTNKIKPVIFPCMITPASAPAYKTQSRK